jgi:hypothetical protein
MDADKQSPQGAPGNIAPIMATCKGNAPGCLIGARLSVRYITAPGGNAKDTPAGGEKVSSLLPRTGMKDCHIGQF